ncbi:MAG: TauD/TfdA dioxygenase family protein [Burkholderiaceae bacterium]|jgi:taurine dioxygenase
MAIELVPLSYSLGVEVRGLDLTRPVPDEDFAATRKALLDHAGLMLLRGQHLTREQHVAFSRRFGELETHDAVPLDRDRTHPEILLVDNLPRPEGQSYGKMIGHEWHSDLAPSLRPAGISFLRALRVPPVGGDTQFANMYAAFEALSPGMQKQLRSLSAVFVRGRKGVTPEWEKENRRLNPPVAQPLVRVHPDTGREALYIGESARAFEGMTPAESKPLLDFLIRHATQPRFVYRHRWQAGDLLVWDNRCTIHLALGDYDPAEVRQMERTTVIGHPSGHLVTPEVAELATS